MLSARGVAKERCKAQGRILGAGDVVSMRATAATRVLAAGGVAIEGSTTDSRVVNAVVLLTSAKKPRAVLSNRSC